MYAAIMERSVHKQETYLCPLVGSEICGGECYDIQMVRSRMVIKDVSILDFDMHKANILCNICPYNQMG